MISITNPPLRKAALAFARRVLKRAGARWPAWLSLLIATADWWKGYRQCHPREAHLPIGESGRKGAREDTPPDEPRCHLEGFITM